jgi:outer membrane protein OmpA-like peptidoglycan-associated protein
LPVDDDDPVTPQPVEQPFTVKLVDETGKVGIDGIVLVFRTAEKEEPVTTDGSGVAQWKAAAEDATVTVKDEKALCDKMAALWKSRPATPQSDYVKPSGDVTTAAARTTALETDDGGPFGSLSVPAKETRVLSIHPAKKRAVIIEMHDTLFRNDSAVVNPEGEAPSSKVGEHESISTVGLIATILRYNEEHPGKKLFIGGHTDRAGSEKGNVKLSEHRAAAVLALIEGDQEAYVAACKAKHSEVDVTQLMDWTNKTYHFKCKPTKLTAAPSDENYVLFRKSYNDWCKGPVDTAEGEIGPRGTAIGKYGRVQDDIWAAMFDLYEHNLRQELGEDAAAVQALRGKVVWVDEGAKFVGYGESHPTAKNTIDGTRSQADRRVEVFLFDEKDAPDLASTQGADVYDGVSFEKKTVEPLVSAKRRRLKLRLHRNDWQPEDTTSTAGAANVPYRYRYESILSAPAIAVNGVAEIVLPLTYVGFLLVEWGNPDSAGRYPCHREIAVECGKGTSRQDVHARLHNLGYRFDINVDPDYDLAVQQFQLDYSINDEKGLNGSDLPPRTLQRLNEIYATADATPIAMACPEPVDDPWSSILGPLTPGEELL